LAFVSWAAEEFELGPEDRVASHAPFHFDLSTFDLFAAAYAGSTVVLVPRAASVFPRETARFIDTAGISVWYSVPWVLAQLAQRGGLAPGDLPTLRSVLFAGEVFPTRPLRELMRSLPHARFVNLYGPTECNVCTWYEVPQLDDDVDEIPIGRAIDGVDLLVVTNEGGEAVTGEIGELYVHGPTVMQGYWGDDARTSAAIVPHPLGRDASNRWLRTGDLVEVLASGDLRFRGRRDAQVKHRGNRVELGDVETAIAAHPNVESCAVILRADARAATRLVAFVVLHGNGTDTGDLRRLCAERLPRYMLPDDFEFVATLPRTSTGKVDRRALQETNRDPEAEAATT
jgi:acyl-coenzyme A synthetase/AMP-(fatty) acid ligase